MDGIDFVLVEYNKKPHSTTGIPPDLFFYSRLKTPADREESKAQIKSMYLFLNETDSRFEPFTNDLMERQEASNARIITMFLESRSEMFRHAETNTAKTQVANRLRSLFLLLSTPNSQVVLLYYVLPSSPIISLSSGGQGCAWIRRKSQNLGARFPFPDQNELVRSLRGGDLT
jgi:hypothetical protein